MEGYSQFVMDPRGNLIANGAEVRIYEGTTASVADVSKPLATIYSDDGVTEIDNPFFTDSTARIRFFAANGTYTVRVTHLAYNGGVPVDTPLTLNDLLDDVTAMAAQASANLAASYTQDGYPTKADMDAAAGSYAQGKVVRVTNDPDPANNGEWIKGASVFTQSSFDRVAVAEGRVTDLETDLGEKLHPSAPPGFAWSVTDEAGKAAIGIKHSGTVKVAEFEDFNAAGAAMLDDIHHVGFAYVVEDGAGKAALGIRDNGEVVVRALATTDLTVDKINGRDFVSVSSAGGRYTHQLNFINNTGQSLGEGSDGTITTVQEYDNVGFPARAVSPAAYLPLTVANTQWSTRGESPIYGTLGHIKELIAEENGLAYADNDYQLLVCNNAVSGRSITELEKGTTYYNNAISQVQAGYDIAQAAGRTFAFQAVTYTQGEADVAMDAATYRDKLITLAADFNTDGKAITGQYNDVIMIMYQCASQVRSLAITHLEAANLSPRIFMACPMYQFSYYDYQHIDALSSKWLGGYYGLVYKRVVIDGLDWEPLQPIAHAVTGSTIDLYFNKTGLTLDTVAIPAQTNYGFDVVDELGAAVTVSSVVILAPNRVRITCAAPPEVGWAVRYGYGNAVGKSPFVGGCGNLRDRQGDKIVYAAIDKPMHNWCVIFNYSL